MHRKASHSSHNTVSMACEIAAALNVQAKWVTVLCTTPTPHATTTVLPLHPPPAKLHIYDFVISKKYQHTVHSVWLN